MYKLVNKKAKTGYLGFRLVDNDYKAPEKPDKVRVKNINEFSDELKAIWEKAGIIKKVNSTKTK